MNICIVEDNESLLANLKLLLDGEPDIRVTGYFTSAEDALKQRIWKKTEILLVDLDLPGMSGIELIRQLYDQYPILRIIVYTVHEDRPSVLDAIRAGACGYLIKGCRPRQLIEALHDIYEGGAPMSPRIARAVLAEFQRSPACSATSYGGRRHGGRLTSTEQNVLHLCDQGLTLQQIAERLSVSFSTVHTHVKHIYRKLHAHNRDEAVRKGREYGLL